MTLDRHKALDPALIAVTANLYGYQKEALNFLLHKRFVLLNLEPGLGKTLIAITASKLVEKTVIVCPVSLRINWVNE